jgi:hypothetical protein
LAIVNFGGVVRVDDRIVCFLAQQFVLINQGERSEDSVF